MALTAIDHAHLMHGRNVDKSRVLDHKRQQRAQFREEMFRLRSMTGDRPSPPLPEPMATRQLPQLAPLARSRAVVPKNKGLRGVDFAPDAGPTATSPLRTKATLKVLMDTPAPKIVVKPLGQIKVGLQ